MPSFLVTRKSGPAVLGDVEDREGLGVARHDEAALGGRDRGEVPAAVAAQQLAEAPVEAANRLHRREHVLHGVDSGVAVAARSRPATIPWSGEICAMRGSGSNR
jgi:hypothetical protein